MRHTIASPTYQPRLSTIYCLIFFAASLATTRVSAGDWPQILGPHRDGRADGEGLLDAWPAGTPKLVWQRPVGRGFSGVAVQGQRVVLFHRMNDEEVVEAMDATSGELLWKRSFPARYKGPIFPDEDGPLCVPVIHGERVFVYGAGGDLRAVALDSGRELWERALYDQYRRRGGTIDFGYFGAGSTPLVEGERVLVNVGGFDGAGIMALSVENGKTLWKTTDEQPSYSSPVAVTHDGVRHALFVTRLSAMSINPADGNVRFQFAFGKRGPTVNAATPLVVEGSLFVTASYGLGAVMADFDRDSIQRVWQNDDVLSSQYATPVYHEGYLYGVDGRADIGTAALRCVDFKTGQALWSEEDFGVASLIMADEKLLILRADGQLVLARPSPKKFEKLAAAQLFDDTVRALPAISNGRFFARDEERLKCYQVGKTATQR